MSPSTCFFLRKCLSNDNLVDIWRIRYILKAYFGKRVEESDFISKLFYLKGKNMENLLTKQEFKKGETIVQEGMESYNVYVVMSGEAEVIKSSFGKETKIRILKKGDVFGAISLITKSPRSATVVARTDMEVGMLYREDFLNILKKLPPDVNEVVGRIVGDLRVVYKLNAELSLLAKEMLGVKRRTKSLKREKLDEYLSQAPELVEAIFVSLDNSLKDMVHHFHVLSEQLDKIVVEIDDVFK